ncbi:UNVERIFIED_CONTAM: hypothetical protein FKN15_041376 [Acipenser sinensis]
MKDIPGGNWQGVRVKVDIGDTDGENPESSRQNIKSICSDYGFSDNLFDNDDDDDVELGDWKPPDSELVQKMVSQIEYYLSDENLVKDAFLLKHVKRNKLGYVNIKLLTSFKKMKLLTKDWRMTAFALRHSTKLELNEEGKKVRRKIPVPETLLSQVPSRLLLVWNLPEPSATRDLPNKKNGIESAIAIFGTFGTISTIRILRPGKELPTDIRKYTYKYPDLVSTECVLVEYEDLEAAGRAYHELSKADSTMKVVLVGKGSRKKTTLDARDAEEKIDPKGMAIISQRMEQLQYGGEDSSAYSSSESGFASSPMPTPRWYQGMSPCSNLRSLGVSPRSIPWASPSSSTSPRILHVTATAHRMSPLLASEMWRSPDTSPEPCRRNLDYSSDSSNTTGSPWVQRRKLAAARAASSQEGSLRQSPLSPLVLKRALNGDLPSGVLRFPRGPDGTKGFHNSIGRGRVVFK